MDLTMHDITELLGLDEKKIMKMIQAGEMPAYKIENEYHFNRAEVKSWCLEHNIRVTQKVLEIDVTGTGVSLTALIGRGGRFSHVPGDSAIEVIKNAATYLSLPLGITREELTYNLLEREELMTTAIGRGVALPHPRQPLITDPRNQMVAICFLKTPIDFQALDHVPVHTLFVILSADAHRHLEILSRISYLCHDDQFLDLLEKRVEMQEIVDYIMIKEMEWNE
jgi:PTS system nitrogen regulatory IIA component